MMLPLSSLLLSFIAITKFYFSPLCLAVSYKDTIITPWMDSYGKMPNVTLYVCFKEDACVANGDIFSLNDTIEGPYVTFAGQHLSEKEHYVYICVDVDEFNPWNPYAKNEVHWLITDIAGSIKPYEHVADIGKVIVPYLQPHKPFFFKDVFGIHRYYNLLFKQSEAGQNITYEGELRRFSVRKFAEENKLGYPVAGVLYNVNYDYEHSK